MADRLPVPQLAKEQSTQYLPKGPQDQPLICEAFNGVATSTTRVGVPDEKVYWMDGLIPLGPRQARTLYGVGDALEIDSAASIVFFQFVNIGATPYALVVHSDGSIHAANTETYASSEIAAAGTITNASRLTVGISQYGSLYALIVAQQTDGYFIWDGTTFYEPGDVFDGSTIPTAIGGTGVETYAGRIWIIDGTELTFSAPGSLTNFSSSGGGSIESTDSFLRVRFIQVLSTNGFLYLIADSSINYISNVQTSGSPATTTFTNQNADPEVGTPWPSAVGTFGRNILFANSFGVHGSYGAQVTKISEDLDGVYNTVANFGGLIPSTAKALIFGKKVWMLLLPIIDPVSSEQVNKLLMFIDSGNTRRWFASEQDVDLLYIQSQEIDSVLTAWGSDGAALYPLFQEPSVAFTKTVQTRLWDRPTGIQTTKKNTRLWGMLQYYSLLAPEVRVTIDNETGLGQENEITAGPTQMMWENNADQTMTWTNNAGDTMTWYGSGSGISILDPTTISQNGVLSGITASTEAADMAFVSLMIDAQIAGYRG